MTTIKIDVYNKFSGNLATYAFKVESGTESFVSTFVVCGEKALKKFFKEYPSRKNDEHLYKFRRHRA